MTAFAEAFGVFAAGIESAAPQGTHASQTEDAEPVSQNQEENQEEDDGDMEDNEADMDLEALQDAHEAAETAAVHQAGARLHELRNNFTPQNIRRAARSRVTHDRHQNHNERFILYLYEKQEYHPYLKDRLLNECRRVMEVIDRESKARGMEPKEMMVMAHMEANTCYFRGKPAIIELVPNETPCNRNRIDSRLRWGTVIKYMRKRSAGN